MNSNQTKLKAVFAAGILLRLVLAYGFVDLQPLLDGRVEITTPISSFKRLREGLFLYSTTSISSKFDIYNGGVFHQSPLLLAWFSLLQNYNISVKIPFIIADILAAFCLYSISQTLHQRLVQGKAKYDSPVTKEKSQSSAAPEPLEPITAFPSWMVTAIYLFNPFTLLGSIAQSTNVFTNTLVITSIATTVCWKRSLLSMGLLALATTLSIYPLCFLPPLIVCSIISDKVQNIPYTVPTAIRDNQERQENSFDRSCIPKFPSKLVIRGAVLAISFLLYLGIYLFASQSIAGSWKFLESTYMTVIFLKDLTPNMGLWWYFFVEMFSFFRPFFISLFQLFLISFSVPITIRFYAYPLFALTTIAGIVALFKPYPEIGDLGLYLSLLPLFKPILDKIKYQLPVSFALLYSVALAPTFYHLWIYLGSGNSNFFYAITLVYALGITIAISDTMWIALRLDYDGGRNSHVTQY